MHEGFNWIYFLSGLPLGVFISAVVFYLYRRYGQKRRLFDERYRKIHEQAQSISWKVTTIAIIIVWAVALFVEGPKLAFFLFSLLWIVHMISYGIGAFISNQQH